MYRDIIDCGIPSCSKKDLPLCKYLDHLKETHITLSIEVQYYNLKENVKKGHFLLPEEGTQELPAIEGLYTGYALFLKLSDDEHFIMKCHVYHGMEICSFWMQYIGSPKEAKNFTFQLKLYRGGSEREVSVTGPVASADLNHSDVREKRLAFEMSFQVSISSTFYACLFV